MLIIKSNYCIQLQLSNKFGMLNDDDDLNGEDVQSPITDD